MTTVKPTMGGHDDAVRGIKPLVPVPQAVDVAKISSLLDEAAQTFRNDPLKAWRQAIVALLPVLHVTDPDLARGHRHMIAKLLSELADLHRGRQPEMLRKRKLPHRPPDSIETWRCRAIFVHTADLLTLTGISHDEADQMVITLCKKYNIEIGSGYHSARPAKIFAGWRKALIARRAPPEGVRSYAHLKANTCGIPSGPAVEARRQVLDGLELALRADRLGDRSQNEADSD